MNEAAQRDKRGREADRAAARTCIVTRYILPPEGLVRFVLGPDASVVPDVARKLPGRGVWVTLARPVVERAAAKGAFAGAFKRRVIVPDGLADVVDDLLLRRAIELLSLSNKAGLVVTGAGKVNSWIVAGAEGALIQAVDASPDGLAKVARKYRAVRRATGRSPAELSLLTIEQLGLAIGRAHGVHAALSDGRVADNFLAAAERLATYRTDSAHRSACKVALKVTTG